MQRAGGKGGQQGKSLKIQSRKEEGDIDSGKNMSFNPGTQDGRIVADFYSLRSGPLGPTQLPL